MWMKECVKVSYAEKQLVINRSYGKFPLVLRMYVFMRISGVSTIVLIMKKWITKNSTNYTVMATVKYTKFIPYSSTITNEVNH